MNITRIYFWKLQLVLVIQEKDSQEEKVSTFTLNTNEWEGIFFYLMQPPLMGWMSTVNVWKAGTFLILEYSLQHHGLRTDKERKLYWTRDEPSLFWWLRWKPFHPGKNMMNPIQTKCFPNPFWCIYRHLKQQDKEFTLAEVLFLMLSNSRIDA